jgi:hypothetical protein
MREFLFSLTKKDFVVTPFRGSGPGGQKENKTSSAIRIAHKESGAVAESQEQRYQQQNKKIAFERLVKHPKFKLWINRRYWEITNGKTIEQKVDEMMDEKNLKVEYL